MTPAQINNHRDIYERLRRAVTPPGHTYYIGGRIGLKPVSGYKTRLLGKYEQGRAAAA